MGGGVVQTPPVSDGKDWLGGDPRHQPGGPAPKASIEKFSRQKKRPKNPPKPHFWVVLEKFWVKKNLSNLLPKNGGTYRFDTHQGWLRYVWLATLGLVGYAQELPYPKESRNSGAFGKSRVQK